MKHIFRGFGSLLLLIAVVSMTMGSHASAATPDQGFNIITSPLPIKLRTAPGRTVTADLRMKNQGTTPETIRVGLMKFGANGSSGQPDIADLTPKDTYAKWVTFSPAQFTAEPNVWKTVKMTINVPPGAALDYYLAVTFSRTSQDTQKQAANFRGSVATLVLLNVDSPNTKRNLEVAEFSTTKGLYEYLPANFTVKLRNKGNVYISAAGSIFIQRGEKALSSITFNEAGGSVLPGSSRNFSVPWTSGFPVYKDKIENGKPVPGKDGKPQQKLSWDFTQLSKFRFGKYDAKLLISYDDGKQDVPIEATVSFWVLPWKLMLLALVIFAAIGFGFFVIGRSIYRKARGGVHKIRGHDKQ